MNIAELKENIANVIDANSSQAKEPRKGFFNSMKGKVATSSALMSSIYFGAIMPAFADEAEALKNAGITKGNLDDSTDGLMGSLTKIVYLIMGVGALWAVVWIIIGGMLLAGSGSNPQKRTGGLAAIGVACIGVYVIYKAYTIAGWAVNL